MNNEPKLIIAGDNDLASEMARHSISSRLADPVYLWRTTADPLVGSSPVVIVADPDERTGFARSAVDAGISAVSLPIADQDDVLEEAINDGCLKLLSGLHGAPVLARFCADCASGRYGRRYGVYAAHRLPRTFAGDVPRALNDLSVFITSLIDSSLVSLRVTRASADVNGFVGWFVLARFADDTIATVEVSAVLPESDDPTGELLVEVTGSDAVLRVEPGRQSILINGSNGLQKQTWYAEPAGPLLQHALAVLEDGDATRSVSAFRLMHGLAAATSDAALRLE